MSGREMPNWRIMRVGGADVRVRPSLLIMAIALVVIFAPQFGAIIEGSGTLFAIIFVVVLYLSILLHELGHLIIARMFGLRVSGIELHLMGGHTVIEDRSKHPGQEFFVAVIGPLVSAAIGSSLLLVHNSIGSFVGMLFWSIGIINIFLAVFNLVPSPPLDGGRMMRAIGWAVSKSEIAGVRFAAYCGHVSAVLLAIAAPFILTFHDPYDYARLLILWGLAAFLWKSAARSLITDVRSARVASLNAQELMRATEPPSGAIPIQASISGMELLKAMAENPATIYALVNSAGETVGSLHTEDVDRAYLESS